MFITMLKGLLNNSEEKPYENPTIPFY
jgi:hypothetical protein